MILKLQAAMSADTGFERDDFVITPHFSLTTSITDADGLCQDLADALGGWSNVDRQVIVKAYDAQGSTPVYPIGSAVHSPGVHPVSICPREVALCLSYFSTRNVPRYRGRLYLPAPAIGGDSAGYVRVRPAANQMAKALAVADILTGLGGVDCDWVVFSRSDNVARSVTNFYVDDEWDTIRSRGLKPTSRVVGTASE